MPDQSIIDYMNTRPVVFDGAMGTMIYERGVFINRCFDEICLTNADLVQEIHREYANAGVDVLETNTFGANRIWLRGYGLGDKVEEINRTGVKLARDVAPDGVYVAGSVGPCLHTGQGLSDDRRQQARDAFEECTCALAEAGVDFLMLETFSHIDELLLAAEQAAKTGLPILASFCIDADGETCRGRSVEDMVRDLDRCEWVNAIGMNCGTGPANMHGAAERAVPRTSKPFVVMPNAGQPQEIDGRMLYLSTPEYFTEYAKRFIELGANGVGGCCGTTPDHIREMAKAVHARSGVREHIEIQTFEPEEVEVEPISMAEKSRLGGKLARGEKVTSVEVLPPRSCDLSTMLKRVRQCYVAGVDAINIPDGPRASARISPMIASIAIQQEIGIEPVLHYCCRDRNLIGMQSDLLGGYAAGIANFLIVTGDPPKVGDYPDVTGVFDIDSIGLTQVAHNLNHGRDIGGNSIRPPSGILIGVGANPCAVDPGREMDRFRKKIEGGAEFAITQPIFDVQSLLRFLDETAKLPTTIPIVAGVWPLVSFKNAEFMKNEVPGVEVPDDILERMSACETREDGWRVGCEIARETCAQIEDAVAGVQISAPFGKVDLALDVLR